MFEQVETILAQAGPDQEVMQNLVQTDTELQELDARFDQLVDQYESAGQIDWQSFFSPDNLYFWIVIVGLILLAIGLGLLLAELRKRDEARPVKVNTFKRVDAEPKMERKIEIDDPEPTQEQSGPIKIKVIKKK